MNLNILKNKIINIDVSKDALLYCINCKGECEFLDYKIELKIEIDKELCAFSKDVLAMRNTGGGYIVVGVEDKTWKAIGLSSSFPYDTKQLRDKVKKATGLDVELDVVEHSVHVENSTKQFALILVRKNRKRNVKFTPYLAKNDFCVKEKYGIRRGDIYFRSGDSTLKVTDSKELECLIDDFSLQLSQDEINSPEYSSFAIEDGNYFLLEKGFEKYIGRESIKKDLLEVITQDPRIWIINVHGVGGVGKSALVNWVVYHLYETKEFDAILHLTAKDKMLTPSGISQCGRNLYSLENLLDNILSRYWGEIPENIDEKIKIASFVLSEYRSLIILDNMETVEDSRILSFIQKLPVENKSKIVITSREQTGGWELPFPVNELDEQEIADFIKTRSEELFIKFPLDENICRKVKNVTGGLPLAMQWLLGSFARGTEVDDLLNFLQQKESPVLEFSFGNIWKQLPSDAKTVLAIMPIFDSPPTIQQISISLDYPHEKVESALQLLTKMTLLTKINQEQTGRYIYVALPITLSFSTHKLSEMEGLELACRRRFQEYTNGLDLNVADLREPQGKFTRYGITTDNEKRAMLLCQRGESSMFAGKTEEAELFFKEARDLAPLSAYVFAMSASHELYLNRISQALSMIEKALQKKTNKNAALCYTIKAKIHERQKDVKGKIQALKLASDASRDDFAIRHQYGVALSRNGQTKEAIEEFTHIIQAEEKKDYPTRQLMYALKTRMINLKRLNLDEEFKRDLEQAHSLIKNNPDFEQYVDYFINF